MTFADRSYEQYSILIAEADGDCRNNLQKVLRPAGFKTYVTESGIEAIEIINSEAIHVLILVMFTVLFELTLVFKIMEKFNSIVELIVDSKSYLVAVVL